MQPPGDSVRILRIAAWIWIGYLLAMAFMDFLLYTQVQTPIGPTLPLQPELLGQPPQPFVPRPPLGLRLGPVLLFYFIYSVAAFAFLLLAYWDWVKDQLEGSFYPFMLLIISTTPIVINVLVVPRFPPGPLANAEGMALRQLPVLFVGLALVAWEYQLSQVLFFGVATTALELGLIYFSSIDTRNIYIFLFIAIIRTISFIAVGLFISTLVTRLREGQASLQQANASLAHYASTREHLAVSRERNRLARELHDTLAHSLTAISVSLETAKAYFDIDSTRARDLIEKSLDATRLGVEETRRALKALRSNALEDLGLGLALQRAAESAASRFHLDLALDLPNPMPTLSPDVEQAIYRVAQEAIDNITRHSQAKRFGIRLRKNGSTTLTIEDDGAGFDVNDRQKSGHFGLVGMRERAELAGGRLSVESKPGAGTKIVLTI
ncbi:MAG: sensor histidine kinase [Chloroflexi bacterium]|nr:sensor histidine kinase [Chloroflexota bacterium]